MKSKIKVILITLLSMLLFAQASSATMIWDGTFHGDEYKPAGKNAFVDSSGDYRNGCLRSDQPAFTVAKDFGGRMGYAGKFYTAAGLAGECATNNHNIIVSTTTFNPSALPNHEYWLGWSMYQSDTWQPRGSGGNVCAGDPNLCMVYTMGIAPTMEPFSGNMCTASNYPNCVYTGTGIGYQSLQNYPGAGITHPWVMKFGAKNYGSAGSTTDAPGHWVDTLIHVKESPKRNCGFNCFTNGPRDGFTYYYQSVDGAPYKLIGSKTNFDNVVIQPDRTFATTKYLIRVGMYSESTIQIPLTLYIKDPKVATTCNEVRNPSLACPGSTIPVHCSNSVKDSDETGIDCGGSCPACATSDTTPPSISIDCPPTGQIYSSQTISVAGTASDNTGISKVEVKAGSGTWKIATGTTSWSVSGLALANGANTVTARATDTFGNIKDASITVTYSVSATAPSGELLFDGSFTSGWKSRTGPISEFTFSCIVAEDRFSALPAFSGRTNVGKFILKPGDRCNVKNDDERNQIAKMWPSSVIGTTQWYGFSFMLDSTWTSNGGWFQIWEFGWPSESINIDKNNHLWIKQAYPNKGTTSTFALSKGVWYDALVRIKLSYGTDGIYEVFIKEPGKTTYSQVHYSTGVSAKSTELAHQLGPYRGASTNTQIIYIADYKVGTTRASVEYGSAGNPAPDCTAPVSPSCTDTCDLLGLECGTRNICGVSKTCGTCTLPEICSHKGKCRAPDDCIPCVYCKRFEKWKIVCNMADEFCTANNYPASFCTEQKLGCESKVDELIAKCHDVSCEESCYQFYDE